MARDLEGTIAVVTGAGGNIGVAICDALRREGVKIVATDIAVRVQSASFPDDWRPLDVTNEQAWQDFIAQFRADYGRLDILVSNAGVAPMGRIEDFPLDDWRRCQAINVEGVFLGLKAATPLLKESGALRRGGASVINIASGAANRPAAYSAAYCTSKAAVAMLTKAAAIEYAALGYAIRVNSVHPGAVRSEMIEAILEKYSEVTDGTPTDQLRQAMLAGHPMGRLVEPDEVADAVVFLASDAARYVHGTELHVDGGYAAA